VRLDIVVREEVVEDVTPEFADDATDDGSKVEERGMGIVEEIGRRTDELCDGRDNSDGPGEEDEDEET
jgi:hypothetical protein